MAAPTSASTAFRNLIEVGDQLDASDVVQNFNDLKDIVNNVQDANFEASAINSRHLVSLSAFKKVAFQSDPAEAVNNTLSAVVQIASFELFPDVNLPIFVFAYCVAWDKDSNPGVYSTSTVSTVEAIKFKIQWSSDGTNWQDTTNNSERLITFGSDMQRSDKNPTGTFGLFTPADVGSVDIRLAAEQVDYAGSASSTSSGFSMGATLEALYIVR